MASEICFIIPRSFAVLSRILCFVFDGEGKLEHSDVALYVISRLVSGGT